MQTIFDLGMHNGDDTAYYLARGYRVVAVEPNPQLIELVAARCNAEVATGQLVIVNKALSDHVGEARFFIADANSEWSSLDEWRASANGTCKELTVQTATFASLVELYGTPYFVKCDIEGADGLFCRQLVSAPAKPHYVSVEGISLDWLALLVAAGYKQFKLSNQAHVRRFRPSIRYNRDGHEHEWRFGEHSSGPFGEDLGGQWLSFQDTAERWIDFQRLKRNDPLMVLDNWFDIHAKLD